MIQNILITLRENKTLQEMLAGIGISGLVATILCLIFSKNFAYMFIGLSVGIAGAVFMVIHMAYTLEDALDLSEKDATNYIRKMTFIRYAVVCVLVIIIGVTDVGHPVMCVLGLMLLKAGAYMQPLIHRIFRRKDLNVFTEEENHVIIGEAQSNLDSDSIIDSMEIQNNTQGGE